MHKHACHFEHLDRKPTLLGKPGVCGLSGETTRDPRHVTCPFCKGHKLYREARDATSSGGG